MKKRSTYISPVREETLRLIRSFPELSIGAVLKGFKEEYVEGSFGAGELNKDQ